MKVGLVSFAPVYLNGLLALFCVFILPGLIFVRAFSLPNFPQRMLVIFLGSIVANYFMVVLIATLQSFNLPLEGAAMILGVDAFMDMARTSVNVLGNCLASVVVARWEGEFDEKQAQREFGRPSRSTK